MTSYLTDEAAWRCVCSRRLIELDCTLSDRADEIAADLSATDPWRAVTPITAAEAWTQQRELQAP